MKHLLKKAFLLLALVGGTTNTWADDVTLFTADFTNAKYNVTFPAAQTDSVSVDESGTTVWIKGYKSKAWGWSGTDGITFTGNNVNASAGAWTPTSPNYGIVIPLTGVNGTITVTTTGDATKWYYTYTDNAKQTTIVARQQASGNNGFTISDLENSNVTLFIGGSGKKIKSITITTPAPTKTIATQGLKSSDAVKVGETTLTLDGATSGYSVTGTTITLSDDQQSATTPNNVKLVNHIVYTDASTEDENVGVSFDGTVTAGYFVGTATIDETGYTVKMKKSLTPTAELSATSGTISMPNSYTVIGTKTVTLTGGNLTNGEYEVTADQAGTTISPSSFTVSDGSVSQEFTITSSASSAATTVFTFGTSDMGVAAPTFTLTYETVAKRSLSQTDVSAATTWDWTKTGTASIQLTAETSPTKSEEFLLSDLQEMPNDGNFNSQALKVICEWPNRGANSYIQGNSIKFNVTVPGTIDVTFSNTGGSRPYRYLRVNETMTSNRSGDGTMVNATGIAVPAGEVVIDFYIPDASDPQERSGDVVGTTMCRVSKIVFTPAVSTTITSAGWATLYTPYALDFSGVEGLTAYTATCSNYTVGLTKVDNVPANTGVVLEGAEGSYYIPVIASSETAKGDLKGSATEATAWNAFDGFNLYVLAADGDKVQFHYVNSGSIAAGKAYLKELGGASYARPMEVVFSDEILTGINEAKSEVNAAKEGKFVVDGKLRIFSKGKMFNANGQLVK